MTPILRILHKSLLAGLLLSGVQAFAQGATTSSDVQLSNGMVMATCETNLDENADYFYEAKVGCVLTDGSGNTLASGNDLNSSGDAVVVLQVQGVPGTTYIVTGSHSAQMNFKEAAQDNDDYPGSRPPPPDYIDEYNYASLDGGEPAPYLPDYSYEGPGPENDTTGKFESLGETSAQLVDPQTPDHLVVVSDTTSSINCGGGTSTLQREIQYQIIDINGKPITQQISVSETFYPPYTTTCNSQQVANNLQCTPVSNGIIFDRFNPGCPSNQQLATGCGFTIPDQKWEWCNPQTSNPQSIGDIGNDSVYNTIISIGGNTTSYPQGTTFPK